MAADAPNTWQHILVSSVGSSHLNSHQSRPRQGFSNLPLCPKIEIQGRLRRSRVDSTPFPSQFDLQMGFLEEFQASIESLPTTLQRQYGLMRDLDKSLLGSQQQNEKRCEQEIEVIRRGIESGNITPDTSLIRFSDEALDEQKHCIRIADEKVALALQCYELVDDHIQRLDQYMKELEVLRQQRELAASSALNTDGGGRPGRASESSRGGRKKTRLAVVDPPPAMDLDLPVDPNEPTYCFCNQVSFGEMVACDNPDCKIEWFHFACVGLKEQPKGKWYCSSCVGMQKRRKGK